MADKKFSERVREVFDRFAGTVERVGARWNDLGDESEFQRYLRLGMAALFIAFAFCLLMFAKDPNVVAFAEGIMRQATVLWTTV